MITCAITDDEPLAREGLKRYVQDIDFLQLVGAAEDPVQLLALLNRQPVDLLFLDIQMPRMSGIDFLKSTRKAPMVILTTAYPQYAIEGYQLNVLDYLLKPITFERFFTAVRKAADYFQLLHPPAGAVTAAAPDYFFIKCDQLYEKIAFGDILYVEALENYVVFHTVQGKYMTLMPLQEAARKLGEQDFIRVHKSYIVAIGRIERVDSHELIVQRMHVPVSRSYRAAVMEKVVQGRLWKRDTE